MSLKGLILSGGNGTRLRPITYTGAKQLVPIANKPILFYGIESMVDAGITEIGIVIGQTGEEIRSAVGDGSKFGAKVTYIEQTQPLGLAHCVAVSRLFLGDDDFIMYLGDNMLQKSIRDFYEPIHYLVDKPAASILVTPVDNPEHFGVAEIDEKGRLVRLEEKPKEPKSNLAMVGVYFFTSAIHEAVNSIKASHRGELEITDAIQHLLDSGATVTCHKLHGWWIDTGKKDPLLECNRLVLNTIERKIYENDVNSFTADGRVVVGDSLIYNSRIVGPVSIADGCVIRDAYIGPYTSIGHGCIIENSEIQNSVLLGNNVIRDISRISDSLIGKGAVVHRSKEKPSALKLMISDQSIVEVE
jgi:glucose-1-phosphate thymidylyltransferase